METAAVRRAVGDVLASIGFFTRFPVAGPPERRLSDAVWAAPVAGALVGLVGFMAFASLDTLGLPRTIAAAGALAATMLATGALHEDGLADVADGFGGGATAERKLEIMKDSRIGTYGVLALLLGVLARWSAIMALPDLWSVCAALLAAHIASRALLPIFMAHVPPARPGGLSAGAGPVETGPALVAIAIGAAALLPLGPAALAMAGVLLAAWALGWKVICESQIGGQTGDALGALQQGGELIVLLVALVIAA